MRRIDLSLVMAIAAFALLFGLAVFGERLAPYEPFYVVLDLGKQPPPYAPGGPFPLGTDTSGRDLLSLILYGARVTLVIAAAAGLGRVLLGLVLASLGSQSARVRLLLDGISEVASALPVTLVAVLTVLALAGPEARALPFVTAMVLTGWPGPYRVAHTELKRLATAPFTESAQALGLRARAILARHHIPHLMPLLAMSVSQQMTASLVALAELGVFAIFIGRVRAIGGSLTSDIPEWGGLLANARSVENLYTTRWVFLVPGLAIASAAVVASVIGIGIANRYRRRDILTDLRSPLAGVTLTAVAISLAFAATLPDRYPEALARGADARGRAVLGSDFAKALAETGFSPVGSGVVETSFTALRQSGPATIIASDSSTAIALRDGPDASSDAQAILYSASGGGIVDAPLVFAGWGISPADYPPREVSVFSPPDFGKAIEKWADDYAKVDVRGKVVVLLKLPPIEIRNFFITPPDVATQLSNALRRGAAGVLFVDPSKGHYAPVPGFRAQTDPYKRLTQVDPIEHREGPLVFVVSLNAADRLLSAAGISATTLNADTGNDHVVSAATTLNLRVHLELAIAAVSLSSKSLVAERVRADAARRRVMVWAVSPDPVDGSTIALDAVTALAESLGASSTTVTVVAFDPTGDAGSNAAAVRAALGDRAPDLLLVVSGLQGDRLQFLTATPEFVPIGDGYADRLHIDYQPTSSIAGEADWTWPGVSAYAAVRTLWIRGAASTSGTSDLRGDAAAFLAYALGRYERGAPEIRR
jgi:peptide/nickel transport system permease protein